MNLKPFVESLTMVTEEYTPTEFGNLQELITLKQTMEIPVEKRPLFMQRLKSYTLEQFNRTTPMVREVVEGEKDFFGGAHYLQSIDYFIFESSIVADIKARPLDPITVDVFGAEKLSNDNLFTKPRKKIPEFKLNVNLPEKIKWNKFETKECHETFTGITAINVNLPLEYYKDIAILDNVLYYDADEKKFLFGVREKEELEAFIEDVATNGIREPLILKINSGTIVSAKNYYKRLLAAIYLQLPTIPVLLYVNNCMVDEFEEVIPFKDESVLPLINKVCDPFFYFTKEMIPK